MDRHGHRVAGWHEAAPARPAVPQTSDPTADWSLLGPPGGDVFDVAVSPVDPQLALAGIAPSGGSGGGMYRSTDGGQVWTPVPELAGTSVLAIEFGSDGRVYLGSQSGVWVGGADGTGWVRQDLGVGPNQFIGGLAVDPSDPEQVWAGIDDALGFQPVNLVRSTDGGLTWQDRTPPLGAPLGGKAIALDPDGDGTVIAGFGGGLGGGSIWVSTDHGDSWQNRSAGVPGNPIQAAVYDGQRLLVGGGLLFGSQEVGLYASDDLGVTWTAWHDSSWPNRVVTGVAVDPADPQTVLVATDGTGVHRTTDAGASWEIGVGGSGSFASRSLRFDPGSSQALFLGTSSLAVWRSTDGGERFDQSADGISELNLTSVAANPHDEAELAVGYEGQNDGGVLTSTDGGGSWQLADLPATRFQAVGFAPDGTLHAISNGPTTVAQEGLYRRLADGQWRLLGPDQGPVFESDLYAMAFSDDDPDLIMLGGRDFGVAGNEATLWRSADDGESWTKVYKVGPSHVITDLVIVADGTAAHQVAGWSSNAGDNLGGVLRSADGGQAWQPVHDGLPGGFFRESRLCSAATDPEQLFLSARPSFEGGAVYRSDDGGVSWAATWEGPRAVDIACDPVDDQVLYLAQGGSAAVAPVVRSGDGGVTFAPFGDGLDAVSTPRELVTTAGGERLVLASRQGSYTTVLREGPPPGPGPDPVVCDETITGLYEGSLTVESGVTCLAAGSRVLGEVNVLAGAGLIATAAVVQGPVSALGAELVEMSFSQVTGPVLLSGAGSASLFGNQVTGSVNVVGTAGPVIAGNTVIGALSCFGNEPEPTHLGLPNTATAGQFGQCAQL